MPAARRGSLAGMTDGTAGAPGTAGRPPGTPRRVRGAAPHGGDRVPDILAVPSGTPRGVRGGAPPGDNCTFCAIVAGELPATMITETGHLLAFLDHRPLFRGHTLLVPKQHMRLLSDLPAALAAEFLMTAQRLERAIEDGLGVSGTM